MADVMRPKPHVWLGKQLTNGSNQTKWADGNVFLFGDSNWCWGLCKTHILNGFQILRLLLLHYFVAGNLKFEYSRHWKLGWMTMNLSWEFQLWPNHFHVRCTKVPMKVEYPIFLEFLEAVGTKRIKKYLSFFYLFFGWKYYWTYNST